MTILRLASVALSVAFLATTAATVSAQTIQVNKENRTIAITATDKVLVLADVATLHIGFIAYGPDSDSAYAAGSRSSNAIVKALTSAGVPNDSIESENQNVSPVQEYQIDKLTPAEKAQRKFQVTQSWTVRTNANDAAKVLDLAVKAGARRYRSTGLRGGWRPGRRRASFGADRNEHPAPAHAHHEQLRRVRSARGALSPSVRAIV